MKGVDVRVCVWRRACVSEGRGAEGRGEKLPKGTHRSLMID